jgi:hypothetical protein
MGGLFRPYLWPLFAFYVGVRAGRTLVAQFNDSDGYPSRDTKLRLA